MGARPNHHLHPKLLSDGGNVVVVDLGGGQECDGVLGNSLL